MQQSNSKWIRMALAIVLGLFIGGALGLLASRAVRTPAAADGFAALGVNAKEEYVVLVAGAYCTDEDLALAQERLAQLEAPNVQLWVADLVERRLASDPDGDDTRALVALAYALGVESRSVLAYMNTLTPQPTATPLPSATPLATLTPAPSPTLAPTDPPPVEPSPTAVEPTATLQPAVTDTPPPAATDVPVPSDTPLPPPTETPVPQPSNTPQPQPSNTPQPTNPPAAKWTYTARLVGPGEDGTSCAMGTKLIRVKVVNAGGAEMPGVWLREAYTGQYRVSGHKGDDPYWGPGEAEFSGLDGGQICVAGGDGGACESDLTRSLSCHDPPPFEDLWAAGYCDCLEGGISKGNCQARYDSGEWRPISWYSWRVEFKRSQ